MSIFEISSLDSSFDRSHFDCGSVELNSFLKTKARQNQSSGFSTTTVAIAAGDKLKRVLGYHVLSMGEILLPSLPPAMAKKLPKHPVPVARMGRLATDLSVQKQGLGKLLLVDAMKKVQIAASSVGVYALLVDAKDEAAKNFYLKYGFIPLIDKPMTLFLPIASFP